MSEIKNIAFNFSTLRSGTSLKIRLFLYIVTFVHAVFMSLKLFNIDFGSSDDPNMRQYSKLKWKLITAWFNLVTLGYLVICIYCDWTELTENTKSIHIYKKLKKIKSFSFSSVIFPTTAFADILFWTIWHHKKELMMPLSADKYITIWDQHSMHTVSLIFVLFELIFVNREKPKNKVAEIFVMITFITLYIITCLVSLLNGEYVYPCFKLFSFYKLLLLMLYTYISHLFYYTIQWAIVDLINNNYQGNISQKLT
ncbi:androgen-dependent TFPI-regulating protein-like [Melitaea cinxia]|uniref:androgen-dependent TFPI-regulating protein-like n=1 Tax=Melitaea cinxia TaxID=113334 RepID=UPI001E272AF6|nr:androgen-dependent TFPI-regulating protein-like [Melitaea cinxia]